MSMDIKQRLRQAIEDAHGIPPLEPDTLQLCQDALASIEKREEYSELLKVQAGRLRACVAAGFTHAPGAGTDLIDLAQLAEDLQHASRRSLGEDS